MRSNPLVTEALTGLARPGQAHLAYLGLLLVQAVVLFLWWPKSEVAQLLEDQHGPHTLEAVVMAAGVTTAYFALRAGADLTRFGYLHFATHGILGGDVPGIGEYVVSRHPDAMTEVVGRYKRIDLMSQSYRVSPVERSG